MRRPPWQTQYFDYGFANPTGNRLIDPLLAGTLWSGESIGYYFPGSPYAFSEYYGPEPSADFFRATTLQVAATLFALDRENGRIADDPFAVEGFTNLAIEPVAGPLAQIRVANAALGSDIFSQTFAYVGGFPGDTERSGDVWLNAPSFPDLLRPQTGNAAWATHLHEIGHALGLKHGHDGDHGLVQESLPVAYDTPEYTVMTYTAWEGGPPNPRAAGTWGYPQTFMMLDIAALQSLYGANYEINARDTRYEWLPGDGTTYIDGSAAVIPGNRTIFATIWDGGGTDTYDLSAFETGVSIDLAPGGHSVFARGQLARLGGGPNDGLARGNIFNALLHEGDRRSMIENAIGGSGNDRIAGNAVENRIAGGDGNDVLVGRDAFDDLAGGDGRDRLKGGGGDDNLAGDDGEDRLFGGAGDDFVFAGDGDDIARGGAGNDAMLGELGDDVLIGGAGDDLLRGNFGNDRLEDGAGRDTLDGGSSERDTIVLADDGERDEVQIRFALDRSVTVIEGFDPDVDVVSFQLFDLERFDQLAIGQTGPDATVAFEMIEVVFVGISASDLDAGNLIVA